MIRSFLYPPFAFTNIKKKKIRENHHAFIPSDCCYSNREGKRRGGAPSRLPVCGVGGGMFRTGRLSWGHTGVAGRWRGRFWLLWWTPPGTTCLHRCMDSYYGAVTIVLYELCLATSWICLRMDVILLHKIVFNLNHLIHFSPYLKTYPCNMWKL